MMLKERSSSSLWSEYEWIKNLMANQQPVFLIKYAYTMCDQIILKSKCVTLMVRLEERQMMMSNNYY